MLAGEVSSTAAKREAGDTGRRDNAGRHGEPIDMRGMVDIALGATGADADCAGGGINSHAFHHRHVDHQPVVDTTKTWPVVSASADRDLEIVLPCKNDRSDNVSDVGASCNHHGTLIDHPVVEAPHRVIIGIHSLDDRAAHVTDEGFSGHGLHDLLLFHNDRSVGPEVTPHCWAPGGCSVNQEPANVVAEMTALHSERTCANIFRLHSHRVSCCKRGTDAEALGRGQPVAKLVSRNGCTA